MKHLCDRAGITLKSYASGNRKALCPKCSHTRRNKLDPCLSVRIDQESIVWHCGIAWPDGPRP